MLVHAQPGARRTAIVGVHGDALKIAVSARPVDGKANEAIVKLVAELFAVPARAVTVIGGQTARRKTLQVDGPSLEEAERQLNTLLGSLKK